MRLFFFLSVLPASLALNIQVVPGPGSLEAARNELRMALAGDRKQSVTLWLAEGRYPLTAPLALGAEDSPDEPFEVTWAAKPGAQPIISGGRELRNARVTGEGHWQFTLPDAAPVHGLIVAGKPAVRARHPNTGYLRVDKVGPDRRSSFTFREGELPAGDYVGAELLFLHDWSSSRAAIASIDPRTRTLRTRYPVGPSAAHYAMDHFEKQPRFAISGASFLLDAPGEWYQAGNSLRYIPREGETPETSQAIIPVAQRLIVARGVANIRFQGITFSDTAWTLPERGHAGRQAAWFEDRGGSAIQRVQPIASAIDFANAKGCELRNCEFRNLGGGGLLLGEGCIRNRVQDCEFRRIGANGVGVGSAADVNAARNNVVDNCLIEYCGQRFLGAVGIWIGIASDTRVTACELRNLPYTGISLGWRWWNPRAQPHPAPSAARGSFIAHNHIHHVLQSLSDGGGIYTLGVQPGTMIRGNHIHHIPVNLGRAESNGMFFDQGSGGLLVEANLLHDIERAPFRFHKAWFCELRNNRVVLSPQTKMVTYNDTQESRIALRDNKSLEKDSPEFTAAREDLR